MLQVKANGFGATVAALTGYRAGLLFPATDLTIDDLARSSAHLTLLLAAMEPFVAKVRAGGLQAAAKKYGSPVVHSNFAKTKNKNNNNSVRGSL